MLGATSVTLRLQPQPDAPATARRTLRTRCADAPPPLLADALLLTSELVTNAAKFTSAMITVAIEHDGSSIAVAVGDDSPEPPELRDPPDDSSGGRGLQLVNRLARAWGWKPTDGGKIVWFRVG